MPELMFVLKSFVIAIVLVITMQIKIGPQTMEDHAHQWMQSSSIPAYLQKVSSGAVLAIHNVAGSAKDFISSTFGGRDSSTQKAGRLNFEFKRSPQYKSEHPNRDE